MNIRATILVRARRDLSPSEKAVAFVFASHDDGQQEGAHPSMKTVAEEAGLQNRESASRITKRLVERGIIFADSPSKGRKCTTYRFSSDLANRDFRVTVEKHVENHPTVTPESRLQRSNRDSAPPSTVTLEGSNRDSPVTQRFEGKEEGGASLMQSPQDHANPERQERVSTRSQIEKRIGKIADKTKPSSAPDGGQRKHLEEGIHRKKIGDAYFDATKAGRTPDDCIREAILAGALALAGNRSVELSGLDHKDLARKAWERIRKSVAALHGVQNFDTRRKHLVAVVTHCLTDLAMDFWERAGTEINAAAHRSEFGEGRASGAA